MGFVPGAEAAGAARPGCRPGAGGDCDSMEYLLEKEYNFFSALQNPALITDETSPFLTAFTGGQKVAKIASSSSSKSDKETAREYERLPAHTTASTGSDLKEVQ